MEYTNSSLVDYVCLSPNKTEGRYHSTNPNGVIDTLTIHHMAGNLSVETCGRVFSSPDRRASSNYGVGSDGRIGMYVEEKNRSWCSYSSSNDSRAVTIEVANDSGEPDWHVSDKAFQATVKLCIDICKRNGIKKINYTGTTDGNLTRHDMFIATGCPGPYLKSRLSEIADLINKGISSEETPDETHGFVAGQKFELKSCKLYVSSTASRKSGDVTGTYYAWSSEVINNRVKVTTKTEFVGVDGKVTGWINYSDIKDQITNQPEVKPSKTDREIAMAVIRGDYGVNPERAKKLKAEGRDPDVIQKIVNEILLGQGSVGSVTSFKIGDTVKINSTSAKWTTGQSIPNWVRERVLYVRSEPKNGTCIVSTLKTGAITGVIETKFLKKV